MLPEDAMAHSALKRDDLRALVQLVDHAESGLKGAIVIHVFRSMTAAARHLWGRDLRGMRISVQGVGNVGVAVCALLTDAGARLLVSDVDTKRAKEAAARFDAQIVNCDNILTAQADILAPCGLGGVLNSGTINGLQVPLVCGAANNQLDRDEDGDALRERGIVYAPDDVVNAGGIIDIAAEYMREGADAVAGRVDRIAERLTKILQRAESVGAATNKMADDMARQIISGSQSMAA
jgi:leucine dehydrogenase